MVDQKALQEERDAEYVAKAGRAIYEDLRPQLGKLPVGSYVVIAVESGDYVTGATMSKAAEAFEKKHGDALAFVRRIGRPTRV